LSQQQWTNSGRRAAAAAVVIAAAVGAACTEVGTDPDVPVSLAFDTLPAPSVVRGDTMRDVNGMATPLAAYAFNADGDSISGADIRFVYVPGDTNAAARGAVTISDGYIIANAEAPTTPSLIHRVVAQAGSLQSQPPKTFRIVESPESADLQTPQGVAPSTADTLLNYRLVDTALTVRMRVLNDSTDASSAPVGAPVPSYPVEFRIAADSAASTLVDSVLFVSNRRRSATLITATGDGGIASATVRVFVNPTAAGAAPTDSIVVRGYANGRDSTTGEIRALRGTPVRMVVHLDPNTGAP